MAARRPPVLLGRVEERRTLDRLLASVRGGQSAALVLRGEAGVGKTALLDHCAGQASGFRVARAAGVESEIELPFAGLHQLCAPMLDRIGALPEPQRAALSVALGVASGAAPERFPVALAALGLLADAADQRPLLCLVDDVQWLDAASAQALGFVARRLLAESVALVFAARDPVDLPALTALPELALGGLAGQDARALLATVIPGPLEETIRDRLLAETRGNPLAIVELPRELAAAQLPGGPGVEALPMRIEEGFRRRLEALSAPARLLLLVAAAEPADDPLLVWRAADRLGLSTAVADETEGLLAIDERVTFQHPLVRSAVYRSASAWERRTAHRALAQVTEADRRAWHLAAAAAGPDEEVAAELERSAGRAQARGGVGAAAAFLERSAALSPDVSQRAARMLAAAEAKRDAGALDAALRLLGAVDVGALDALAGGRVDILRGEIAFDQLRAGEAAGLLAGAARRLEPVAPGLARKTHLEALDAAMWAGDGARAVGEAAMRSPPPPGPPVANDALLDAVARRACEGHRAAAPSLQRALRLALAPQPANDDREFWPTSVVPGNAILLAQELWDADAWRTLTARHEQFARDTGALVRLQFALGMATWVNLVAGELRNAELALAESRTIAHAVGNPPILYTEMLLAAWRGEELRAAELIEANAREANARGLGRVAAFVDYAQAVLDNGRGDHASAQEAAQAAFEPDHPGFGPFIVPELAEAAARTGDAAVLTTLLDWMTERTSATPTAWSLATEARVRALLSEGEAADVAYREAIEHLRGSWLRPELARAELLYGEWLRRDGRRADARDHLRTAHESLAAMGMHAFAERARRELMATGEKVRKRVAETQDELTPQERQIAQMARDGLSNQEIGARLFLSPRTIEWHLKHVFSKLGIKSRRQLREVLLMVEPSLA